MITFLDALNFFSSHTFHLDKKDNIREFDSQVKYDAALIAQKDVGLMVRLRSPSILSEPFAYAQGESKD
jgi:hypothetical protein